MYSCLNQRTLEVFSECQSLFSSSTGYLKGLFIAWLLHTGLSFKFYINPWADPHPENSQLFSCAFKDLPAQQTQLYSTTSTVFVTGYKPVWDKHAATDCVGVCKLLTLCCVFIFCSRGSGREKACPSMTTPLTCCTMNCGRWEVQTDFFL